MLGSDIVKLEDYRTSDSLDQDPASGPILTVVIDQQIDPFYRLLGEVVRDLAARDLVRIKLAKHVRIMTARSEHAEHSQDVVSNGVPCGKCLMTNSNSHGLMPITA
jgi:hypothetical protein